MSNVKEKNLDFFNKILKKNKEKEKLAKEKKVIKPNNKYEFDDCEPKEPKIKIIKASKVKAVKQLETPEEKAVKSSEYYKKNRDLILQKKKDKYAAKKLEEPKKPKEPKVKKLRKLRKRKTPRTREERLKRRRDNYQLNKKPSTEAEREKARIWQATYREQNRDLLNKQQRDRYHKDMKDPAKKAQKLKISRESAKILYWKKKNNGVAGESK